MSNTTVRTPPLYVSPGVASAAQRAADAQGVSFSRFAGAALSQAVGHYAPARVTDPPVYGAFGTAGPSLVRDVFEAKFSSSGPALDRLARLRAMQGAELARLETTAVDPMAPAQFAVTTGNASQVIPPGYRPDEYPMIDPADRPFAEACTRGVINNSGPFNIPGQLAFSGATGTHVEGVNPTGGTLTIGVQTVSPTGVSGVFEITREIAESSNPAIDAVAMQAMQESYSQQAEAIVYAELNGAGGQGGTITSGFVPSGAQARTATGTGTDLRNKLKAAIAEYSFRRKRKARRGLLSEQAVTLLSGVDAGGVPLLDDDSGDDECLWRVLSTALNPAPAITANGAGDGDVFILSSGDAWLWERPLLEFRFGERAGPGRVDLAVWGSLACRLLRPVGLSAIRYN